MDLPQHGLIRRAPDCQRRGRHGCCLERFEQWQIARLQCPAGVTVDRLCRAEIRRFAYVGTGRPRARDRRRAVATCPSPFGPEAIVMPSLSKWPSQIKPRRPAMARAARTADRPEDRDSIFWGFERLRRATGILTTWPALSRTATIGFIFAARYLAGQFLDAAPLICLIVLLGHKRTAATHEHNRACRSRIARCARSATAAADRWVFEAAPRQCAGIGRRR